jgi:hypothetical protein
MSLLDRITTSHGEAGEASLQAGEADCRGVTCMRTYASICI